MIMDILFVIICLIMEFKFQKNGKINNIRIQKLIVIDILKQQDKYGIKRRYQIKIVIIIQVYNVDIKIILLQCI